MPCLFNKVFVLNFQSVIRAVVNNSSKVNISLLVVLNLNGWYNIQKKERRKLTA